tara:strand:- start:7373 stop:7795 length:423 start_codon:yes stop_codon:yes gene_type:complete
MKFYQKLRYFLTISPKTNMKTLIGNITGNILLGIATLAAVLLIAGKIVSTTSVIAQEPLPQYVQEKADRVSSRIESIDGIDLEMKPLKQKLGTLQLSRDNLAADNNDDSKSLERWGYEYDWETRSVRKVVDLGLGMTLPQ